MSNALRDHLQRGWRKQQVRVRPTTDFSVSPEIHAFMSQVSWDFAAADRVSDRMSRVPSGRDYLVSVWSPVVVGAIMYFVIALSGWTLAELLLPKSISPVGIVVALGLALLCLLLPLMRQTRLDASYTDQQVMNRLIRVIEVAEAVERDVTSGELRLQLAKEIHKAADFFDRAFARLRGLAKGTRKQRKRHARQCSMVLHTYADIALHGDGVAIIMLRQDFARSVLRVGSGNWSQVAHLDPSIQVQVRRLDFLPALDPKWIAALAGALILQIVQVATKATNP